MKAYLRTGLLYFLAIATVTTVLVVLRSRNGTSHVAFSEVRTTSMIMLVGRDNDGSPLVNESAPSRAMTLRGFEVTYIEQGAQPERARTHVASTAADALTLHRLDQLHIKDIVVKPGTRLFVGAGDGALDLMFDGNLDCCRGRIGAGESVGMSVGASEKMHVATRMIDPASPNLLLRCAAPPCSISLNLLGDEVQGFIESRPASIVTFDKPGTAAVFGDDVGESGILGGAFEVTANDLLGNEFTLRKVSLARGDGVTMVEGHGRISLDVRENALLLNSVSNRVGALRYRLRAGPERNLLPSLLELMLREPWRPSLFAIFVGVVPGLVAFIKARLASRLKKGAGRSSS